MKSYMCKQWIHANFFEKSSLVFFFYFARQCKVLYLEIYFITNISFFTEYLDMYLRSKISYIAELHSSSIPYAALTPLHF